jgi:hypothetical protein
MILSGIDSFLILIGFGYQPVKDVIFALPVTLPSYEVKTIALKDPFFNFCVISP